jgi:hypothetical protein
VINNTLPRSDNNSIHDREVALGALEAKNEMEKEQPQVTLKHDPTAGINLDQVTLFSCPGVNFYDSILAKINRKEVKIKFLNRGLLGLLYQ